MADSTIRAEPASIFSNKSRHVAALLQVFVASFELYLESPNTGEFSSEINVDLEVVPLFPRQNYSSFFQPRSQPRERVSFSSDFAISFSIQH